MSGPHWVCPRSRRVCFPRLHCSGSWLLCRERALSCVRFPGLSRSSSGSRVLHKEADSVGPGFCAFPIRAAQAARSLMSTLSPGAARLLPSPVPASVPRCVWSSAPLCLFWGAISSCDSPGRCQPSRISGSLWLEMGSLFAVW